MIPTTEHFQATHVIAKAFSVDHQSIKARVELILAELVKAGSVTSEAHAGGFKWALKTAHPSFDGLTVAYHDTYRNGSQARYECLKVHPTVALMLAATSRVPAKLTAAFKAVLSA